MRGTGDCRSYFKAWLQRRGNRPERFITRCARFKNMLWCWHYDHNHTRSRHSLVVCIFNDCLAGVKGGQVPKGQTVITPYWLLGHHRIFTDQLPISAVVPFGIIRQFRFSADVGGFCCSSVASSDFFVLAPEATVSDRKLIFNRAHFKTRIIAAMCKIMF